MSIMQSNGKQISYVTGRGGVREGLRTLVFVHGSGGDHLLWNSQKRFFEKFHNVVAVDLPGHGEAGSHGENSIGAYAQHLLNLLRELPGKVFCLFGHSLGGAIVQEFTLLHPQYVEALVLVGTGARLRVLPEILEGIQTRFEETVRLICDYAFSKKTPRDMIEKGVERTRPADFSMDLQTGRVLRRTGDRRKDQRLPQSFDYDDYKSGLISEKKPDNSRKGAYNFGY